MLYTNAMIFTPQFVFQRGEFAVEDGRFVPPAPAREGQVVDLQGAYVLPGLIDIHIHGCAGCDFSDGDEAGLRRMAAHCAGRGVTSLLPTSMSLPYPQLERAFSTGRRVMEERRSGESRVLGFHMEGPFLSPAKKGAQREDHLKAPDFAAFESLFKASGGAIRILDVAPELPGAADFTRQAARLCRVSVAHTGCDYDQASALYDAGACHLTHLYQAMTGFHHRAPGPIPAAAEREEVTAELIADAVHSHPAAIRLAFRLFPGRLCLVSDAMRGCGMPDGLYDLGGQQVAIRGRRATLPGGVLAGSVSDLYTCMRTAIDCGVPREAAIRAATYEPARAVGVLDRLGSIEPGKLADFLLCDQSLALRAVYIGGEQVSP